MPTTITLNTFVFIIIYIFAAFGAWVIFKVGLMIWQFRKMGKKLEGVTDPVERERLMDEMVKKEVEKLKGPLS